jgi:signal transduction histidine kinase
VCVRVLDTGRGIPAAEVPHVFDRFYRVDKARSREAGGKGPGAGSGAGIGLAIARHILEMHGSRIYVERSSPEGTVFAFHLPAQGA